MKNIYKDYWKDFKFNNDELIQDPNTLLLLKKYLQLAHTLNTEERWTEIHGFIQMTAINSKAHDFFCTLIFEAFSSPNSFFRDDNLAIHILKYAKEKGKCLTGVKQGDSALLTLLERNKPGQQAEDFEFIMATKQKSRLYNIDADYTLLYFYNPDCEACRQLISKLNHKSTESVLLGNNVKVLAVLVDSQTEVSDQLSKKEDLWINATKGSELIESKGLYDLRAIPSLLLLDENKKVILKDSTLDEVIHFLLNASPYSSIH